MSKPWKARPSSMWLNIPQGAPHPGHVATMHAELTTRPGELVAVSFDAEEAAALGRRLLDFAGRADVVTAVRAVGTVMRMDRT